MKKTPLDMVIQAVLNGSDSIEDAIKMAGVRDLHFGFPYKNCIKQVIQAQQQSKVGKAEEKHPFEESDTQRQKSRQTKEKSTKETIVDEVGADSGKEDLVAFFHLHIPQDDKLRHDLPDDITEVIDILSMPWKVENNWKYFLQRHTGGNGKEYLTFQKDIPTIVKDAIEHLCHTVERERLHRENHNLLPLNNRLYDYVVDEVKDAGIDPKEITSLASLDEKLDKNGSAIIITLRNGDMYKMILSVSLDKMNRV